jgi:hypothetical protein
VVLRLARGDASLAPAGVAGARPAGGQRGGWRRECFAGSARRRPEGSRGVLPPRSSASSSAVRGRSARRCGRSGRSVRTSAADSPRARGTSAPEHWTTRPTSAKNESGITLLSRCASPRGPGAAYPRPSSRRGRPSIPRPPGAGHAPRTTPPPRRAHLGGAVAFDQEVEGGAAFGTGRALRARRDLHRHQRMGSTVTEALPALRRSGTVRAVGSNLQSGQAALGGRRQNPRLSGCMPRVCRDRVRGDRFRRGDRCQHIRRG